MMTPVVIDLTDSPKTPETSFTPLSPFPYEMANNVNTPPFSPMSEFDFDEVLERKFPRSEGKLFPRSALKHFPPIRVSKIKKPARKLTYKPPARCFGGCNTIVFKKNMLCIKCIDICGDSDDTTVDEYAEDSDTDTEIVEE